MAENTTAPGLGSLRREKKHEGEPRVAQAVTQEATLPDPRAPWADAYEVFADEKRLTSEQRRVVRLTVLRIRVFGAVGHHRPRPRRARC